MATAGSTGSINLTKRASSKVLERLKFGSCTEGLFSHAYSWTGVATVQIYMVDTLPLNDYNPEKVDGGSRFGNLLNVGDTLQELTVKDNKSFIGVIEESYNTQQMQIKRAGQIIRRQTDEVMIPYIDKYRLRKLASYANSGNGNIASATLSTANIVQQIMLANAAMSEKLVPDTGRVLYMSYGRAIDLKLAQQVVGAGPVDKGSLGEKAIVNGVMGKIDKCQIRLVPAGYLPNNVEFMIVKSGEAFAPTQIKSYKIHDGAHVLDGKIVTGHLLHDCFIPQDREKCVFVVTKTGSGEINPAGTGTISATATSVGVGQKAKIAVTLGNTEIISAVSSDETKAKAHIIDGDVYVEGIATGTPKAVITITAAGKPGYTSPAPATSEITVS